ncbi:MAG TPA: anhydro-N-acetylmuramic acid kinase [Planctomycetes bacterium]|nr:anhydro-N-acetylmuramic acid kinase [Planctomycetota bacterium]
MVARRPAIRSYAARTMYDSLDRLRARLESGEAVVAGCLSGTSADGIDVVLVRFDPGSGAPAPFAFRTLPFEPSLRRRLRSLLDTPDPDVSLEAFALLHRDLGEAFGHAVGEVCGDAGVAADLVGSHGQTLWHHDGRCGAGPASLQLGDGARIAVGTGAVVVNDFRAMDLALGGEGAPVSALADPFLFPNLGEPVALLNLGGMANLTLLAPGRAPLAFDTGPAGSLLDGLARRLLERDVDEGGAIASGGRASEPIVAEFLAHPFFRREPPKSTGRDTFGVDFVDRVVAAGGALAPADLLASAVELVARSVADALERFARPRPARLLLCGGGIHNRALRSALAARTGLAPESTGALGVDPDAREALVFAVLARLAVLARPCTSPAATGARGGGVLGAIHLPPVPAGGRGAIRPDRAD